MRSSWASGSGNERPSASEHQSYPARTDTAAGSLHGPKGEAIGEAQASNREKANGGGPRERGSARHAHGHTVPGDRWSGEGDRVLQEGVRGEGSDPPTDRRRHPE